jgi:hypothetical protein
MAADLRGDLLGAQTSIARLWSGILAGPTGWILQLMVSYPIAQLSCHAEYRSQHPLALQVVAFGALVIVGAGGVTAWRALQAAPAGAMTDGGRPMDRAHFMAQLGLLFTVMFTVLVVATAIPSWILHACQ